MFITKCIGTQYEPENLDVNKICFFTDYSPATLLNLITVRIVHESRNSRPVVLYKNSCSKNFAKFSRKHSWWGPVLIKLRNEGL